MHFKQHFQQELQEAMRAQDQPRVNVIRMLLAAFEQAQESMGKQSFESLGSEEPQMKPDRQQTVSEQAVKEILQDEVKRRREALELLHTGGQKERAASEETEIAMLEEYLKKL